jgi:hypothetical protein
MCRWCHGRCGDVEFCSPECYEAWLEAQAEAADGGDDLAEESPTALPLPNPAPPGTRHGYRLRAG